MSDNGDSVTRQLGRGMIIVLAANVINMVFNVLLNFIQPKYLSVDTYSQIKTFALYLSATGVFHLGYEDGTYLKYGGKKIQNLDKDGIGANISTLRIFQFVVMLIVLFVGVALHDNVLIIFAFLLLPYNMTMQFRLFYQATGNFGLYGRIMNFSTSVLFIGNVLLIFLLRREDYYWYLWLQVLIYLVIWIALEINLSKTVQLKIRLFSFSVKAFVGNIRDGFFIMIGNFSSIFLTSMDRWFVKLFLTNADFAAFSFAVSMEGFITVAISPFTVTLFNYFCQEQSVDKIKKMHNYILLFAAFIVSAAFPVKFILEVWLTEYIESTGVLFYLFASQILFIIIKSIYVNLYKARQQQTKYFVKLLIVLGSGALFSLVCYSIMRVKEAMAMGTLLSSVLWFVLCQFDFKEIIYDWKHYLFLILSIISFVTFGNLLGGIQGFILYLLVYITSGILLIRKDVMAAVLLVKNILLRKK